jgi:ankyrin repeat protein
MVRILIEAKADVNLTNCYGGSALLAASRKGFTEIVRLLIDSGAKKNNFGPALMTASFNGHTGIVKLLIQAGADVNTRDSEGWSAIDFAAHNLQTNIVKLLTAAGTVMDPTNEIDSLAFMQPISSLDSKGRRYTEIVELMLKAGANANATNEFSDSALMMAFGYDDDGIDLVKALLEKGADPNYKGKSGSTALRCARVRDCKGIVKLLKKYGAME